MYGQSPPEEAEQYPTPLAPVTLYPGALTSNTTLFTYVVPENPDTRTTLLTDAHSAWAAQAIAEMSKPYGRPTWIQSPVAARFLPALTAMVNVQVVVAPVVRLPGVKVTSVASVAAWYTGGVGEPLGGEPGGSGVPLSSGPSAVVTLI